jgi:ABC-2 type transport system permease protein
MMSDIYTVWLRDMRLYLVSKAELVISIIWPLVLVFFLGLGVDSFLESKILGTSYTVYLGPGIIAMFLFLSSNNVGYSIIEDKKGFIKSMLVAPISRSSIIIGKILSSMTNLSLILIVFIIIQLLYTKNLTTLTFINSLLIGFLISFGAHGFGILIAVPFSNPKIFQYFGGFVYMAIVFLSGIFYPIHKLPFFLKSFSYLNPLTYGVDALRWAIIGKSEINIITDLVFLSIFSLLMIIMGAFIFNKTINK